MGTTNLLDAKQVNFQDLIGNGKSYSVPQFQRDYAWREEQWEDLWLDIVDLQASATNRHYMGAVVVKAESDRRFLIIDGQQRIATLTILALAVIHRLTELSNGSTENENRADALRNRFIGEIDPASLTKISKLTLNQHDDGFFKDYLVQLREPSNPRALVSSNRLLWECFSYFVKKLKSNVTIANDGLKLAELISEVVARRLLFIQITVEDDLSAYTVFETLNARGLELTTTDLLKNYLFSRLNVGVDLASAQTRWLNLLATVRQDRFGEFLRYHYLTRFRQIRSGRLFKIVRDEVETSQQVFDLLEKLESRADLFDALSDENSAFWLERPEAKAWVAELNLLKVRQMTPLLFAAFEKLPFEEFIKVLKCVASVSFRYTTIGGLNPNELEWVYHDASRAVLDGTATSARQVFNTLAPIYVQDDKFRSDFAQRSVATNGQRKKVAKYILCKLEEDASGKPCSFLADPGTIEHILPENPLDEWEESIPREKWEQFAYRLGNLTLLKASTNRDMGSKPYELKVAAYSGSEYLITKFIPELAPEQWTIAALEARQEDMASRALHIWKSDFAEK